LTAPLQEKSIASSQSVASLRLPDRPQQHLIWSTDEQFVDSGGPRTPDRIRRISQAPVAAGAATVASIEKNRSTEFPKGPSTRPPLAELKGFALVSDGVEHRTEVAGAFEPAAANRLCGLWVEFRSIHPSFWLLARQTIDSALSPARPIGLGPRRHDGGEEPCHRVQQRPPAEWSDLSSLKVFENS